MADIVVADFDGNGTPDLAALEGAGATRVSVFLGRGTGTFFAPVDYDAGMNGDYLTAADLDRDGHLDLVVSVYMGAHTVQFRVLLNQGKGAFGPPQTTTFEHTSFVGGSLKLGDLDGDGLPDVLLGNQYVRNRGGGVFEPPVPLGMVPADGLGLIQDMNGDSKADIVSFGYATQWFGSGIQVLLGQGGGRFGPFFETKTNGSDFGIVFGHLDGDKWLDAVVRGESLTVLFGVGGGALGGRTDYDLSAAAKVLPSYVASAAIADFDADGKNDVIACIDPAIAVLLLNSGGGQLTYGGSFGSGKCSAIFAADLNDDKLPDLVIQNEHVSVRLNRPSCL